jgi:hypothetical protein
MNLDLLLLRAAVVIWTTALYLSGICCVLAGLTPYACAVEALAFAVIVLGIELDRREAGGTSPDERSGSAPAHAAAHRSGNGVAFRWFTARRQQLHRGSHSRP